MTRRFAFKMKLKPGYEREYQKRHAAIWPELVKMIKEQGVGNYSIYWDRDTNILFAYQECSKEGNSQDPSPSLWRRSSTSIELSTRKNPDLPSQSPVFLIYC